MAKEIPFAMPPEGEAKLVVHDGVPYAVMNLAGRACAYVAACSHKDLALVPLRLKKGRLVCPHHGARFDPETGACVDDAGKDVPCGLPSVEVVQPGPHQLALRARKRHKKLLKKKERKRVAKEAG